VVKTVIATLIAFAYFRRLLAAPGDAASVGEAARRIRALDVPNEIALYAVVVTWLVWQARAHRAVRAQGTAGLRFSPKAGVLWWFVPGANLVMPYRAMRELRTAGGLPSGEEDRRATRMLLWGWWIPWIGQLGVAEIILFVPRGTASDVLIVLSQICVVLAAPGAILAVRAITDRIASLEGAGVAPASESDESPATISLDAIQPPLGTQVALASPPPPAPIVPDPRFRGSPG
jgi:Domain of unknown function (DUF4328)